MWLMSTIVSLFNIYVMWHLLHYAPLLCYDANLRISFQYEVCIKPKQQVIGINIQRQDEMQGEVLLLHRKRQGAC